MRFVGTALAAIVLSTSVSTPAEATRPIVGYPYKDVCKNIKGHQPIYAVVGATARYQFKAKRNGGYFKHKCVVKRMRLRSR